MKAKIKVQSIQVQYYFKDAEASKKKIHIVLVHKKKDTFLLSELNGIVYNFNANFDDYGPIIKIKRSAISKV
jgi:glutathionyl-hydroquinone reductase